MGVTRWTSSAGSQMGRFSLKMPITRNGAILRVSISVLHVICHRAISALEKRRVWKLQGLFYRVDILMCLGKKCFDKC